MKEIFINEDNLTKAYHQALVALNEDGETLDCKAYNTIK